MKKISITIILNILLISPLLSQSIAKLRERVEHFMDSSDYKNAKPLYDTLLMLNPSDDTSYFNRGICEVNLEDYLSVINDFSQCIKLDHNNFSAFSARASSKSKNKDTIGSLRDYDSSININPNDYKTQMSKGLLLYDLDSLNSAIFCFSEAIRIDSSQKDSYYFRAQSEFYSDKDQEALIDINKSIQMDSTDYEAYYFRGKIKLYLKDYLGSIEDLTKSINNNPKNVDGYINRGLAYYGIENIDSSYYDFTIAASLGSERAKKLLIDLFEEDDSN